MNKPFRHLLLPAFVMSILFALPAAPAVGAQADPRGAITRTPETARPPEPAPQREEAPGLEQTSPEPKSAPGGPTLHVREFRFTGAEFLDMDELQARVAHFAGRDLTLAQIEEAVAGITQLCQQRGYMLTRAYLPRQDARDGILTIAVLVGRYDKVISTNNSLLRDSYVEGMLRDLQPGDAVRQKDLERAMLLLGDLPGVGRPAPAVEPGREVGTTTLGVTVPEAGRFGGYLSFDNYGSRYTGIWRMGVGASVNSPLGIGDRLSFSGMGTEEIKDGLWYGNLTYSLPVGYSGLRAEFSAERTTYTLNKEYSDLDSTGRTDNLSVALSYPLIRSVEQNLWLRLSGSYKYIVDEIQAFGEENHKYSLTGKASIVYNRWFKIAGENRLYTAAAASLTYGKLHIFDADDRRLDNAGPGAQGDFAHLGLNFLAEYSIFRDLSLSLTVNAQQTVKNKNLDGSEQFIASGPSGVRAYRESVTGDNGYFVNGELRYQLPNIAGKWKHSLGAFAAVARTDYGDSRKRHADGDTVKDAGIGYYANCDPLFVKAQLAQIIGKIPEGVRTDGRTHFLVQFGVSF